MYVPIWKYMFPYLLDEDVDAYTQMPEYKVNFSKTENHRLVFSL